MSFTFARSAAGVALLAVLAAGCGTAAAAHSAATHPGRGGAIRPCRRRPPPSSPPCPAGAPRGHHAARPPATTPAQTANPIPQGNGGDQDADNNGGPSDGDGNI